MNRRGFIGALGAVLAAAAAPQIFLPREPVVWKKVPVILHKRQGVWVPNPEYATAQYEIYFVDRPALFDSIILEEVHFLDDPTRSLRVGREVFREPYPMRFKDLAAVDRLEPVHPFIPA